MSSSSIFKRRILLCLIFFLSLSKIYTLENTHNDLINISAYSQNPSSNSWNISVDFLAWYPSEEVSSIWADVITIGNNTSTWEAKGFNFKWDYGLRLGAGYNFMYDLWDTALYWTWFQTETKHTIPFEHNASISPEFYAGFLRGDSPQSMNTKWSIHLNMFDWQLGKNYWISEWLFLRPFLGIKGGWIDQSIHAQYYNLTINHILTNNSADEHLKNNFWGIGPIGGFNTKWKINNSVSNFFVIFGDFSTATMWGSWICEDEYQNTASQTSSVNIKKSTLGSLMFRGFMGIEWNVILHSSNSHFTTKLGYEMQLWLNQLRFATFQLQRLHGDLTLQGLTFNCRLDF